MTRRKPANTPTNIQISGVDISRIEYRGEPVVTFAMVDEVHQRPDGTAGRTFRENRTRFVEGEDFVSLDQPDEIRRLGFTRPQGGTPASVILLTRRGYLKLVKPLTDDRAWAVQGEMIDRYFLVEQIVGAVPLDAEARKTIGGIVKSVVHSELQAIVAHEVETALAADPRRAVLAYVSVRQLLDEAKALTKGRRSLNRRVGNELRTRAVLAPPTQPVSKCPHSGVWLFPRDFAAQFMVDRGMEMVRTHNDRVRGQGVLKLVRSEKHEDDKKGR
ncbi:hypothetical protein KL86PLE_100252 [uncultured Pleomorphomonas sp.]|uniref:KilA-N DNA-binding domain-containing protein n=1 Tax=uncultured Pleomorphomonas sp. TaxID=442121 RepID=A0A212L1W3_9HYPH|nr:ORF6N domain-containing protein [uncultured Pleomorphomonas sp.]SCM71532.1 hypothetical protein KL86PLE_100252 [uncultured Pleomorphomonas sp.]